MWNHKKSTDLSILLCFTAIGILAVLIPAAPFLLKWYTNARYVEFPVKMFTAVLICFYTSAVVAFLALYELVRMLFKIRKGNAFCKENVRSLRVLSWCCATVAVITAVGTFFVIPFIFVAAAALFMSIILRVVKNVMEYAVKLREENDLTI